MSYYDELETVDMRVTVELTVDVVVPVLPAPRSFMDQDARSQAVADIASALNGHTVFHVDWNIDSVDTEAL